MLPVVDSVQLLTSTGPFQAKIAENKIKQIRIYWTKMNTKTKVLTEKKIAGGSYTQIAKQTR